MELASRRAIPEALRPDAAQISREVPNDGSSDPLGAVVLQGLTASPKRLPPWLLYDDAGSALFEEITRLPQYYLTRTERSILGLHAGSIMKSAGRPAVMVELGAGSASKTCLLLSAWLAQQRHATYVPVDVSPALPEVADQLRSRFPRLTVNPVSARYPEQLDWLASLPGPRLVLFLGSSIGNYDRAEALGLMRALRVQLRPGDALLLGTDLVKPEADAGPGL